MNRSDTAAGAASARIPAPTSTVAAASADPAVAQALARGGLVDLTTTGRRTGQARTVEIVFHVIDGRIYISGIPRPQRRSWLANLEADPRLTIQLKVGPRGTGAPLGPPLTGRARIIDDEAERRAVLPYVARA